MAEPIVRPAGQAGPPPLTRGRRRCRGVLIDAGLLGTDTARARVLSQWRPGSDCFQVEPGLWLLTWPDDQEVDAARAPGLPVLADGPGWRVTWAGRTRTVTAAQLTPIDVAAWFDLALPVTELAPIDVAEPSPPLTEDPPPTPAANLRQVAGVRADPDRDRQLADLERFGAASGAGGRARAERRGDQPAGGEWTTRLVRLLGAATLFERRYAAYLRDLESAFRGGDYDRALRRAISVGSGGGRPSMRLPRPRSGPLKPGSAPPAGAGVPGTVGVEEFLRDLYLRAAADLERAGQPVQAAFVHADLLGRPADALALLERHELWHVAAELAEGTGQTDAAIRLWWRAGHRERAVDVAIRHRSWAAAVAEADRRADTETALALRGAWVAELLVASDVLGAIDVAWQHERTRPLVRSALGPALAGSGAEGAGLLALLMQTDPDAAGRAADAAVALLADEPTSLAVDRTTDDPTGHSRRLAQRALIAALVEHRPTDPWTDRRVAAAALLRMAADPRTQPRAPAAAGPWRQLRRRADPILVADLPSRPAATVPDGWQTTWPSRPGTASVRAAIGVRAGVLVACGDHGVQLLNSSGRVKTGWSVAADEIAAADHGQAALIITRHDTTLTVHRLDLTTRALSRWTTIPGWSVLGFDGRRAIVLGPSGIAVFDTLSPSDRPRVVWRELDPTTQVLGVQHTPTELSAVVRERQPWAVPEVWRWRLPDFRLLARRPVDDDPDPLRRPDVVRADPGPGGQLRVTSRVGSGHLVTGLLDTGSADLDASLTVRLARCGPQLTGWDESGRIVVIDTDAIAVLASFRLLV